MYILILLIAHILGIASSFNALMSTRTSQGAIAWIVSLNTVPLISLPLYWFLGRSRFNGYVNLRKSINQKLMPKKSQIRTYLKNCTVAKDEITGGALAAERLAHLPFLKGNSVDLLINGEATFDSLFSGIGQAKKYILLQFYMIKDDKLGNELKKKLIAAKKRGVSVWCLYDELGSDNLTDFSRELIDAGIHISGFNSTKGGGNVFQLNFRNHRKVVVIDGEQAWMGGHNVGIEYMSNDSKNLNWRDTHIKIIGPAALALQVSFIEDWYWAKKEVLPFDWQAKITTNDDAKVLIVPSGPGDELETCSLMYQQAIHMAKERFWLATPYFVPDEGILNALILASLRGVDVKIILPDKPDSWLVYFSAHDFVDKLLKQGVEVYRYLSGFMHQKVFLIDQIIGAVSTANVDNRSLRLNFEITALVANNEFVTKMEKMFIEDKKASRRMTIEEINKKPLWFKVCARASYLMAPIQ